MAPTSTPAAASSPSTPPTSGAGRRATRQGGEYPDLVYSLAATGRSRPDAAPTNVGALVEQATASAIGHRRGAGVEGLRAALNASFEPVRIEGRTEWRLRRGRRAPRGAGSILYGEQAALLSVFDCLADGIRTDLARLEPMGCHVDSDCESIVGLKAHIEDALVAIQEQLARPSGPVASRIARAIDALCGATTAASTPGTGLAPHLTDGLLHRLATELALDPTGAASLRDEALLTAQRGIEVRLHLFRIAWAAFQAGGTGAVPAALGSQLARLERRLDAIASSIADSRTVLASVYIQDVDLEVIEADGESMADVLAHLEHLVSHAQTHLAGAEGRTAARELRTELSAIGDWIDAVLRLAQPDVPRAFQQPRVRAVLTDLGIHVKAAARLLDAI